MLKIEVTFIGRKAGTLGITYEIKDSFEIEDNLTFEDFQKRLYDKGYECVKLDRRDVFIAGNNERLFYDLNHTNK